MSRCSHLGGSSAGTAGPAVRREPDPPLREPCTLAGEASSRCGRSGRHRPELNAAGVRELYGLRLLLGRPWRRTSSRTSAAAMSLSSAAVSSTRWPPSPRRTNSAGGGRPGYSFSVASVRLSGRRHAVHLVVRVLGLDGALRPDAPVSRRPTGHRREPAPDGRRAVDRWGRLALVATIVRGIEHRRHPRGRDDRLRRSEPFGAARQSQSPSPGLPVYMDG